MGGEGKSPRSDTILYVGAQEYKEFVRSMLDRMCVFTEKDIVYSVSDDKVPTLSVN